MTDANLPQQEVADTAGSAARIDALRRFGAYALKRFLMISATIFLGVYLTVLIANKEGDIDQRVSRQVIQMMRKYLAQEGISGQPDVSHPYIQAMQNLLMEQEGGNLPTPLRNMRWTLKALTFDWGPADFPGVMLVPSSWDVDSDVSFIILEHLPNTLLLIGAANLLIFFLGIPLALQVGSRRRGQLLYRFITLLSPVSSIPSWIHGILLVAVFAAWLQLLPFGGKYDNLPPETEWGYILVVGKHMILPVAAILMSMFFQLVYVWRTYLVLYSEEDYVDLAVAKGVDKRQLEQKYILRPSMPYILTSFALTLVGFWQMTTALEYFFNWPGIGQLYVRALPNFRGEQYYVGEMGIIISVVALFAYLLGFIVFLLDIAYAWLDPRIRLLQDGQTTSRLLTRRWNIKEAIGNIGRGGAPLSQKGRSDGVWVFVTDLSTALQEGAGAVRRVFRELIRFPSAVIGLFIISAMVVGSLYTVIALPYREIGAAYYSEAVTGKFYAPRNALPEWINRFREEKLPTTTVLSSTNGSIVKTSGEFSDGIREIKFSLSFDYDSREFPQDVVLYLYPTYSEKRPFISPTWITPDGREFILRNISGESEIPIYISEYVKTRQALEAYPNFGQWYMGEGASAAPAYTMLMADPEVATPKAIPGSYTIILDVVTFEESSDLDVEFVLLGKVFGKAGTDSMRRDLIVPLLWGMPFALGFGLLGAFITTLSSMIISALSVWRGGWIDNLVQRLTEANMILPVLAVGILVFALYHVNLYLILVIVILMNIFGSPTKLFRSAFLQVKEAPYIEAAKAYGASNLRIIFRYMIPRILPTVIPQLVIMIPSFVFLEATLAIFNVFDPSYPTWGKIIHTALTTGAWWAGFQVWMLEPIVLLLLAGLGFSLVGYALERVLNPRLLES